MLVIYPQNRICEIEFLLRKLYRSISNRPFELKCSIFTDFGSPDGFPRYDVCIYLLPFASIPPDRLYRSDSSSGLRFEALLLVVESTLLYVAVSYATNIFGLWCIHTATALNFESLHLLTEQSFYTQLCLLLRVNVTTHV